MSGIVEGGWEFVWAAYALTAVGFVAYTASIVARSRESRRRSGRREE